MTDYAKGKLNKAIKEYIVKNEEKNELAREVKEIGAGIKDVMGEEGIEQYEVSGIKAVVKVVVKRELDKDKIAALLGGKIPEDCYVLKSETRLTVK